MRIGPTVVDLSPVASVYPLAKIVADVNVDGLAFRARVDDLIGIGGELSGLGQSLKRSVEPMNLAVTPCPRSLSFSRWATSPCTSAPGSASAWV
jgi:hypothetical protein